MSLTDGGPEDYSPEHLARLWEEGERRREESERERNEYEERRPVEESFVEFFARDKDDKLSTGAAKWMVLYDAWRRARLYAAEARRQMERFTSLGPVEQALLHLEIEEVDRWVEERSADRPRAPDRDHLPMDPHGANSAQARRRRVRDERWCAGHFFFTCCNIVGEALHDIDSMTNISGVRKARNKYVALFRLWQDARNYFEHQGRWARGEEFKGHVPPGFQNINIEGDVVILPLNPSGVSTGITINSAFADALDAVLAEVEQALRAEISRRRRREPRG